MTKTPAPGAQIARTLLASFPRVSSTSPGQTTLQQEVEAIRTGTGSKELCEKIRARYIANGEKDDAQIRKWKAQLPCFTLQVSSFEGKRSAKNARGYTGILQLDIDAPPLADVPPLREKLRLNPHILFAALSPKGKLKAAVKVDTGINDHARAFDYMCDWVEKTFGVKPDKAVKNLDRVCFRTYDPDVHFNPAAKVLAVPEPEKKKKTAAPAPVYDITDHYGEAIQKAVEIVEREMGTYGNPHRHSPLTKAAGILNIWGIPLTEAENGLNAAWNYQSLGKDYAGTVADIYTRYSSQFASDPYKPRRNGKKLAATITKPGKGTAAAAPDPARGEFWEWKVNKKTGEVEDCIIQHAELSATLARAGFRKYYPDGQLDYILIHEQDKVIEEVAPARCGEWVQRYLAAYSWQSEQERAMVAEAITRGHNSYFGARSGIIGTLPEIKLDLQKDTETAAYFYFKNCFVQVDKDSITPKPYSELTKHIWRGQIKDFDYVLPKPKMHAGNCVFARFCWLVSDMNPGQLKTLETAIGYLLHRYRDVANLREVAFLDQVMDMENETAEGGTGKGILTTAISHIRNVATVDGRAFNAKSPFAFQNMNRDTEIVAIQDLARNFDETDLFSKTTDKFYVERKNMQPFSVEAKIITERNYYPKGRGHSVERRKFIVEIAPYYRELAQKTNTSPIIAEHGQPFFTDKWGAVQWEFFYTYMLQCVQVYLANGLQVQKNERAKEKQFIANTSPEWAAFCEEGNIALSTETRALELYTSQTLMAAFCGQYPEYDSPSIRKWFNARKLREWVKEYADYVGATVQTKGLDGKDIRRNGCRYFYLLRS